MRRRSLGAKPSALVVGTDSHGRFSVSAAWSSLRMEVYVSVNNGSLPIGTCHAPPIKRD